eukprot:CAMPEP_0172467556 /NCGR_PEP_ID=MMETSP1065-20121228/59277_1 /TAXON_ID=265537 /ORGANISM="Amphiprora paludosa, Strain CCMP125" /LENGTH=55 /DNA_ID=CAMNT_0013224727 /DNA_START=127 /DNA_END=290 /DNA_ORIENTATION=+
MASTQQSQAESLSVTSSSTLPQQDRDPQHDTDDTIFALSSGMGLGGQATAVAVIR